MELRDKEIERLNRALQGGRPHDVIALEAQNMGNEKLIAHLNLQASAFTLMREYSHSARGFGLVDCIISSAPTPIC